MTATTISRTALSFRRLASLLAAAAFAGAALPAAAQTSSPDAFAPALAGSWRSEANKARDAYRHPAQTLAYFGVRPEHTVIELLPGGANAWYPEVLAPTLRERGHYIAALFDPAAAGSSRDMASQQRAIDGLKGKFAALPAQYDKAEIRTFALKAPVFGPPASADVVLTFRNVHNWVEEDAVGGMFRAAFAVLKPGGVFGVVDHRAAPGRSLKDVVNSGYLPVEYVIEQGRAAGFVLAGSSEVNANPKDTKDHARGVWTLPPVLALREVDREKYLAIGESDRFTLRFVKP